MEESVLIEVFDKLEFDPKNQGTYPGVSVQCLIKQGLAHIGQKLTLLPQNLPAQIISMQNSEFKNTDEAKSGELVTVKLNIQDSDNVQIGSVLSQREVPQNFPVSKELKAEIHFLESANPRFISDGYKCIMHKGSFT